jgi:hypothetical protein
MSNIAARPVERDCRVKVPEKSLALFVRLRQRVSRTRLVDITPNVPVGSGEMA